jgi:RNA polymerase sigma factor (TIGR02999 family)
MTGAAEKAGRSDLLEQFGRGGAQSLSPATYAQLKRIAQARLRKADASVEVTSLVHETYDRLRGHAGDWKSRSHFLAVAGRAMWQVLVDRARRRAAEKRGGGRRQVSINVSDLYQAPRALDILDLEDALGHLEQRDAVQAELVRLILFAGLPMDEIAKQLRISKSTAEAEWRHARAWLRKELGSGSV